MEIISPTTAKVSFRPTVQDQKRLQKKSIKEGNNGNEDPLVTYIHKPKEKESEGLTGQFIVEYDVARDPSGGQVLVSRITQIFSINPNTQLKSYSSGK